jgi:hypothetical protein
VAARVHRRTLGARLTPLLVAGAALLALAAEPPWPPSPWSVGAAVVLALAAAGAVLALGDEVVADDRGLLVRNRLLGRQRSVAWGDIADVRVVSRRGGGVRVIFVFPRRGRRLVLDALTDMEGLAARVRERTDGSGAGSL